MTPVRGRSSLILIAAVFSLALGSAAHAFNDETARDWSEKYYLKPEPDRVPEAIKYLRGRHVLTPENRHARAVVGLFAGIFHDNSVQVGGWLADVGRYTPEEQKMLLQAAWLSDTDEGRAVLAAQGPERLTKLFGRDVSKAAPPTFAALPVEQLGNIDILWGHFYGTGDAADVRRIIGATKNIGMPAYINNVVNPPGKIAKDAVSGLTTNAIKQPKVYAVVSAEQKSHPDSIILKNIIQAVEDEHNHTTADQRQALENPKPPCEAYTICRE